MPIATGAAAALPALSLPLVIPPANSTLAVKTLLPTITLGGQILNSPITDVAGIGWIVNKVDGWDAPEVRNTQTPRGNDHGDFREPAYYGPRLLIVHGSFVASRLAGATDTAKAQALMAAREQLHAAENIMGSSLSPYVVSETPPKMCMVQRMSGCKDGPSSAVSFDFEAHLLAPDPRKYDPAPTVTNVASGATAVITNNGNMESRPILTVYGPVSGFYLDNLTTGQTVVFAQNLGGADVFVVDMDFRSATLNGVSASVAVASNPSQWWTLAPGGNTIGFRPGTGTGSLSVSSSSAWI